MTANAQPATDELARRIEFSEAGAYADLMRAAPAGWNWRTEETGSSTVLVAPGLDIPLFNRVIGLGLGEAGSEAAIDAALGMFDKARVRNFAFQMSPAAGPPQMAAWLAGRGLLRRDNWAKVYRKNDPPVPRATPLRIEHIGAAHAGVFAAITCAAFRMPDALQPWIASTVGRPGWHHYLALDAGAPVAAAAMHVRGDTAWLGIAGTHPLHRRRGAQGALMARRIEDGIALGCTWFVTETSEDTPERPNSSFHNMVRSGFLLAYQRPNYMRP